MSDAVLVLNAGSSSIKFGLFDISETEPHLLCKGLLDEHDAEPRLAVTDMSGKTLFEKRRPGDDHDGAALLTDIFDWISDYLAGGPLLAVGHRVVHGGRDFVAPVEVTDKMLEALDALIPLAPLHQPRCLSPIRTIIAPAALPVTDPDHQIASARSQANRLLRHRLPSWPCTTRQPLCDTATL